MSDHAFLAVALSDDERHALAASLSAASPGAPLPGRRTPPQNWHITLRYLGECTDPQADAIMYELALAVDVGAGKVVANGLSRFPKASKASVLFAQIDDATGVAAHLAGICEEAARDVGFEPEERPFVPHVTLSRLRPARDVRGLVRSFGELRVPIEVTEITLYRSRRTREGIQYEAMDTIELGS